MRDMRKEMATKSNLQKRKLLSRELKFLRHCIKISNDDMLLMDKLIQSDLSLPDDAMPIKEKWRELAELRKLGICLQIPQNTHLKIPSIPSV